MLTAPHTAQQIIGYGLTPIPIRSKVPTRPNWQIATFQPSDWLPGEGIGIRCGKQRTGRYLYVADIDSHSEQQDAPRYLADVERRISPALSAKLAKAVSTGGQGRYIAFYSRQLIPNGTIHNQQGHKAGEFLGEGRQVVYIEPHRWLARDYTTLVDLDDHDVDELLAALNYKPARTKSPARPSDHAPIACDDPTVKHWYEHAHELEDSTGVPRAIGQGISRNLLTGKASITNASEARYMVMFQMYRVGYTDAQILGYAMRRCDWNREGWKLRDDCLRILGKLKLEMPDRHISPAAQRRDAQIGIHTDAAPGGGDNNSTRPHLPRKPGRPAAHPEQKLRAYLTQDGDHGVFDDTNEMLAAALYCDVRTIKRYLNTLEQQGKIERRYTSGGRVIVLTPEKQGDKNSCGVAVQDRQDERMPASESVAETAPIEETRVPSPPSVEPVPRPLLKQAVREAVDAYGAHVKRIQRYIDDNFVGHPWTADAIKCEYRREKDQRKRRQLIERIEGMKAKELCRAMDNAERHIAKSHERENNAWKFWIVYRDRCYRKLKQLHAKEAPTLTGAACQPQQPLKQVQPGCLEKLRQLLDTPQHIPWVEQYMRQYPGFDYGDVPHGIAQLRRQGAASR